MSGAKCGAVFPSQGPGDDVEPNVHVRLQCEQVGHPEQPGVHGGAVLHCEHSQEPLLRRRVLKTSRRAFFAGCVSTLLIALAAPPLATIALQFGPAEYFSLMVCGLVAAVVLAHRSLVQAIAMVVLGLLLGLVGTDVNTGARRFNFGMMGLADGIEFVAIGRQAIEPHRTAVSTMLYKLLPAFMAIRA